MTTEKHLYLALEAHRTAPEDTYLFDIACQVIREFVQEQDVFSEEDFEKRVHELVHNHTIDYMIKEGLLEEEWDEDGKIYLKLTPVGEKSING